MKKVDNIGNNWKLPITPKQRVGFEQIAEMLKSKSKNNKSKTIYFIKKDINKYLSPVAIEILTRGI